MLRFADTSFSFVDDMAGAVPPSLRYLARYGLLALGAALATFGLIGWTDLHFDLHGFWLYDNGWRLHPVHFLVVGLGLIPPAIWEVFVLETARHRSNAPAQDPPASPTKPDRDET